MSFNPPLNTAHQHPSYDIFYVWLLQHDEQFSTFYIHEDITWKNSPAIYVFSNCTECSALNGLPRRFSIEIRKIVHGY